MDQLRHQNLNEWALIMSKVYQQHPGSIREYSFDYEDELGTDTISTSTWTLESGLGSESEANTDLLTSIKISVSGTTGEGYKVLNEIVTVGGDELNKTFYIRVLEQ